MEHWNVVKWILRYLRGTTTKALCFIGSIFSLSGLVDFDLVGDVDTRRSTTGHLFIVGVLQPVGFLDCRRLIHFQPLKLSM